MPDYQFIANRTKFAANVAGLASVRGLAPGDVIQLRGRLSAADGTLGTYYYDAASTATADGWFVVTGPSGTGRFHYIGSSHFVTPEMFGAVGDGSTDDSAAIQAAIDYCFDVRTVHPATLLFVRTYKASTSLDLTYTGGSAGTGTRYWGLTVRGVDVARSGVIGACADRPVFDLTGSPRCRFENFSVSVPTDANNPSCAFWLARNTTNGIGGNHYFGNLDIRGYYTAGCIIGASSEVNKFVSVSATAWKAGAWGLALLEQNDLSIVTDYLDLSGHTFSGGNTRTAFHGCEFANIAASGSGGAVWLDTIDSLAMHGCYTKASAGTGIKLTGTNSNIDITDLRDESVGTYGIHLSGAATLTRARISGRTSRHVHGDDSSVAANVDFDLGFVGTSGTYSYDLYDATGCSFRDVQSGVRVRNDASRSKFPYDSGNKVYFGSSPAQIPAAITDATKTTRKIDRVSFNTSSGGNNWEQRYRYGSALQADYFNLLSVRNLLHAEETHASSSGTVSVDLAGCTNMRFSVTGSLTVNTTGVPPATLGQLLRLSFYNTNGSSIAFNSAFVRRGWRPDIGTGKFSSALFVYTTYNGTPAYVLVDGTPPSPSNTTDRTVGSGVNDNISPTISAWSQFIKITLQSGASNYTGNANLPSTGIAADDWIEFEIIKPASAFPKYTITGTSSAIIFTANSGQSDATARTYRVRCRYNGSAWYVEDAQIIQSSL